MRDKRGQAGRSMKRLVLSFVSMCSLLVGVIPFALSAQETDKVVISAQAQATEWFGQATRISIDVTGNAPMRSYVVDDPVRLILDLEGVQVGVQAVLPLRDSELIRDVRAGAFKSDIGRIALTLAEPAVIREVTYTPITAGQRISVILEPVSDDAFAARPEAPAGWARVPLPPARPRTGLPLVILDPGHGGIDPGAIRDGISEKDIALSFAHDLAEALHATGKFDVTLTRDKDIYLGLSDRIEIARAAEADIFLSLHANTVTEGNARGTALYTLSGASRDEASDALAVRENAAELFNTSRGTATADVAQVLFDLAQRETDPRSNALARDMVVSLRDTVGVIRSRPHRSAGFAVLRAPDIPSVLIELGFLSDPVDRENMLDPEWRSRAAVGIANGLMVWTARDARLKDVSAQD